MRTAIAIAALMVLDFSSAHAQAWSGAPAYPGGSFNAQFNQLTSPSVSLSGNEAVIVGCTSAIAGCANMNTSGAVPLSEFARASDFRQAVRGVARQAMRGAALVGALQLQAPGSGLTNRVGLAASDYDGRAAIGVSYMHQWKNADFGVAGSFVSGGSMGKASIGYSW